MLRTLLESNAPRQRRRASTLASIAVHTALIAAAVVATASARADRPQEETLPRDSLVFVRAAPPRSADDPARSDPPRGARTIADRWPIAPRMPALNLVREPVVGLPAEIDSRILLRADTAWPVEPRGRGRGSGSAPLGDEPATLATVDRAAAILSPPRPRYPDPLRVAGVTGRVVVRLVVDTTGLVEPSSVVIREASHDLFAQAVRAVLPRLRFVPAESGGRKVRMLVDLPFEFRLNE
jgi:protein TonB